MNSPVSGLPATAPPPAAPRPVIAPPPARRKRFPWGWVVCAALIGLGYFGWSKYQEAQENARATTQAVVRTATAGAGRIDKTIRLTGVTAAERFVSLVTPQLRANRSGRGRDGGSGGSPGSGGGSSGQSQQASAGGSSSLSTRGSGSAGTSGGASRGTGSSGTSGDQPTTISSTAGAVSGGTGGSSAQSGQGGSTGGGFQAPSSTSAFQSATSRINRSTRNTSSTSSSQRSTGAPSSTLGADGLGSTGSQLNQGTPGGGGGGQGGGGGAPGGGGPGGSSEFMLILQDLVKPGSRVRKGDLVAEFDRQFMLQRVDDYRTSVTQQAANLKKMKAELEVYRESHKQTIATAKADLDKARLDMKTIPVLSDIDAERVKLTLAEAEAQYKQLLSEVKYVEVSEKAELRISELDLKSAELELRRAQQNADRMLSKAAIEGMTVMQNTFRGAEFAQIQQGDQLFPGQFFMQIVDTSSMVINGSLNQVDAERLRIGQKATVRFDAYPDLVLPAHVQAIAAVTKTGGFRATYVKEIPIRLKLDKIDPRVIPDLSVSVDVVLESEEAVASVPLSAVFRDGADSPAYVLVRDGNTWRRREVEVGLANFTEAAVRSGLKPGEIVAAEKPISEPLKT